MEILADFVQWLLHRCVLNPAVCTAAAVADLIQLAFGQAGDSAEPAADSGAVTERGAGVLQVAAGTLWAITAVSSTALTLGSCSAPREGNYRQSHTHAAFVGLLADRRGSVLMTCVGEQCV